MSKDKKKKKKRVRNKGRDVFADYYLTNKEYSKENERRQAEMPKKWGTSEKGMLAVILIGLVLIFVKYVILR